MCGYRLVNHMVHIMTYRATPQRQYKARVAHIFLPCPTIFNVKRARVHGHFCTDFKLTFQMRTGAHLMRPRAPQTLFGIASSRQRVPCSAFAYAEHMLRAASLNFSPTCDRALLPSVAFGRCSTILLLYNGTRIPLGRQLLSTGLHRMCALARSGGATCSQIYLRGPTSWPVLRRLRPRIPK